MNPTPCFECNNIRADIWDAYISRRWRDLLKLYDKQAEHEAGCTIIHSDWYKSLWPNAVVVEVTP